MLPSVPWTEAHAKEFELSSHTIEIDGHFYGISTVQDPHSLFEGEVSVKLGSTSWSVGLSPAALSGALTICGLGAAICMIAVCSKAARR